MYSREINGQEYTFGVSGKLINNALVMFDRQTNSLWSQILGEAVQGPLKGTTLEFLPAIHTTWADWKEQFPETTALVKGYSGEFSTYENYYQTSAAGVLGETYQDDRLSVKSFVIGVENNGEAVAYPFGELTKTPVLNDEIGGLPVVILFRKQAGAAVVFSRVTEDGQLLTFVANDDTGLSDVETGSTWDSITGVSIDGPLVGTHLTPVKSTVAFWFGWKDFFPQTRVYGQE